MKLNDLLLSSPHDVISFGSGLVFLYQLLNNFSVKETKHQIIM